MIGSAATKPIGSFPFILALYTVVLISYVLFMPAFEGADEPDHLRYIEAVYKREKIHPVDPSDPRRHGVEIYQPPLYYYIAAFAARFFPAVFPDHLAINPLKNPNCPFLVHDEPGEIFPFDPVRRTLRLFRALSVLLGIAAFVIFARILRLAMPKYPQGASVILLVAALWPSNLQIFSVASNDALVYVLSLSLVLAILHCTKTDQRPWMHGLIIGVIGGLGLLTKMSTLITVAALFPVVLYDVISNKSRIKYYFKMLPGMLFPVILLAGPFLVSGLMWYGSATRRNLLNMLTPSLVHEAPLPLPTVVHNMWQILPVHFLADLCWQHLTLPPMSVQLFMIWFLANVIMTIRLAILTATKPRNEQILHMVLVSSSFFFMFFALYYISVNWVNMQFRHVWNLWPITLLAPYFVLRDVKLLRDVNPQRIFTVLFPALLGFFILVNVLILYSFVLMYKPIERVSRPDLDFFTFSDYYAESPHKAAAYLDTSGLTDVMACRYFIERKDWNNALHHARWAIERDAHQTESRLMCSQALQALGKPQEALEVLHNVTDRSFEAQILEIQLLMDMERFREASDRISQVLPHAPQEIQPQLKALLKQGTER